ncbi:MAG: glycoside hydrolase family 16, partial [Bacteroidales bacterium]|nr:glycoside hydrolase family 16 [Bacteroidales bacterium]
MQSFNRVLSAIILFLGTGVLLSQSAELPSFTRKYKLQELGENVFVFDTSMNNTEIQSVIDTIFARQSARRSEFSLNRFALMFRPGIYDLDIRVEYYMHVMGLGESPEDVVIRGAVRSNTTHGNSVLTNFWRAVENLTVVPSENSTMVWGVSQAAPLRRVHVKGNLQLFDKGYASGGFLADSEVDGTISSGPQQQWFTRNSSIGNWVGGNWNMMFMGVPGAPAQNWPEGPYTTIDYTPVIREKPWLTEGRKGFEVRIPPIRHNSAGPGWTEPGKTGKKIPLKKFYIVRQGTDDASTINSALRKGKNLLITPGRYFLNESIKITRPGTVVMGTGLATLIPVNGNAAVEISDEGGVIVCGLTIDADRIPSGELFVVGERGSEKSHASNPVFLYDIFFRVGGPAEGSAESCLVINSNDVIIDHVWLWRADHGTGVGWDRNRGANGLTVNGDNVTVYGLFNEHFQEYQTLWNGNNGRVFFYQSEMPYDPPTAEDWTHNGTNGYASYKVADHVTSHEAWGLGIYNVFYNAPVIVDTAIETPPALEES